MSTGKLGLVFRESGTVIIFSYLLMANLPSYRAWRLAFLLDANASARSRARALTGLGYRLAETRNGLASGKSSSFSFAIWLAPSWVLIVNYYVNAAKTKLQPAPVGHCPLPGARQNPKYTLEVRPRLSTSQICGTSVGIERPSQMAAWASKHAKVVDLVKRRAHYPEASIIRGNCLVHSRASVEPEPAF